MPRQKEAQLRNDSEQWDTSTPEDAKPDDIPTISLDAYFSSGSETDLNEAAEQLRVACEEAGFFSITGHHISSENMSATFEQIRRFHGMPLEIKKQILMDRPDWPVSGMGYLSLKNRKLPARQTGNVNEALIIKCDDQMAMDDNQWPDPKEITGFREHIERYAMQMETLSKRMLPIYARALDMPIDFFTEAFVKPKTRPSIHLSLTHKARGLSRANNKTLPRECTPVRCQTSAV